MRKVALGVGLLVLNGVFAHSQPGKREWLLTNKPVGLNTVDLYGSVNPGNADFEVPVDSIKEQPLNGDIRVRLETGSVQQATSADVANPRSDEGFTAQAPLNGAPWWIRVKSEGTQGYAETTARLEASPTREDSRTRDLVLLRVATPCSGGRHLTYTSNPAYPRVRRGH